MKNNFKTDWKRGLGRMVDGYGKHQKWWWWGVLAFMMIWFAYDVGRLVTRADLLSGSQNIQGNINVHDAVEKSKEGPGRLIVISNDAARYIDSKGMSWNVPDFAKTATRSDMEIFQKNGVLIDGNFSISVRPVKIRPSDLLMATLMDFAFKLMIVAFYGIMIYFVMRYVRGGSSGRFKKITSQMPLAKIEDVAGYNGVKQELLEVVDYLKDPTRFQKVGARPPKGVLLHGPPGNGKTLLAKAVAGEAKASFFEQSASSFIQIYAGEGAKSVRQLFDAARAAAPAVIFIDEIDAVGASRAGAGAHDERLQTVNAILTEMDGFANNNGIVVVAATNRLEVLDEALIRPGRFDRKVYIGSPSFADRELILKRHGQSVSLDDDVDWKLWAHQTKGFSGADLAAFVNESAIEAARRNSPVVNQEDLAKARDRVLIGAKNHGQILSEKEREIVAVHELGHAFMRLSLGGRVEKVSILPRGQSLGVTVSVSEDDMFLHAKPDLEKEIKTLLSGKAAEIVVFGQATTGALDDLQKASELARYVCSHFGSKKWGTYVPASEKTNLDQEAAEYLNNIFKNCCDELEAQSKKIISTAKILQQKEELEEAELLSLWKPIQ